VTGSSGSISQLTYTAGRYSGLVSYWPSIVFQDDEGTLQEIQYNLTKSTTGWSQNSLNVIGWNSSRLAEVPLRADFLNGGVNVFYQRDDQEMISFGRNSSLWSPGIIHIANLNSWLTTAELTTGDLSVRIPPGASIGAFAVRRPQDTNNNMDVYVLWQDASSSIQMMWLDDESGWKGPSTYTSLNGSDSGTSIACLTPSAWPTSMLEAKWDMSRCYFQAGGMLREVLFNGTDWISVGIVPTG
jgi:hypothetical protein